MTWLTRVVIATVCPLAAAATVRAQTDHGKIAGTVRDATNAYVPEASIVVKNERTGDVRTATTAADGGFVVGSLKPSAYTVRVTKTGFAPVEYTGLPLAVGQELHVDFEFKPAGVQESITVVGSAPVLDLSSARMGVNVSELEVQTLPVNGRQMSQLLLQAPGSQNAGTGTWQDIRFSGRAVEQNVIRYDGIEGSAIIDSAPGNLNGEIPTPFKLQASLENVQEFRVESNSYPAEYGTGTGGQVSVVTKSGTNGLHGSAFEYLRNEKLDAPNYFDTAGGLPKSMLRQNQFGGSLGGPLVRDRAFFFSSYEGYRLKSGINFVEAIPSAAAWSRAVPSILPLRDAFKAPSAVILSGASANADFDIAQLQGRQEVHENAFSGRLDVKANDKWSAYVRVFHDQGTNDQPEGVTGRRVHITDNPSNAVFNLLGLLTDRTINELKFGYNSAPTRINGIAPTINGIDLSSIVVNLSGSVANTGIAGQGASSGIAVPGGLVRANSATNGRGQPYDPYSVTVSDTMSWVKGTHYTKFGGEARVIRMSTDRLGGTTYTFANLGGFLANTAQTIQYLGDVSEPSAFNGGAAGPRHLRQEYYIGFAQDEWRVRPNVTVNYGVRYDYYTPMKEADNLLVKFNIDTGAIDPNTTPLFKTKKNSLQPRISLTVSPTPKTVVRGGFGIFVGPGQTEDQIQPIESDRISSTLSGGAFPIDPALLRANFTNNPANRSYQPRAYANEYTIPERIYQYTASIQRELGANMVATAAYVGSQGRNLFLRSVANQITQVVTNPNPAANAIVIRQFSIPVRDAAGNITGVQNPFAEVDFKTSGGHDNYNAMQLSLTRRMTRGVTMNAQYTLSRSYGNTGGSNEALTAANNALTLDQFEYDLGYNAFDVRHTFNLSAVYSVRGWQFGGIVNARSGLPVDVRIVRPDVVYVDGAGKVFTSPAAGRSAVVNTPGGGASRNVRRPDLVPGVDPFIHDGGLTFLNPEAFATPAPGTFGNLRRGTLHGPNFRQVDLVIGRRIDVGRGPNVELRAEVFNLFNADNFANPIGTLPAALPANSLTEAGRVQPGEPYTAPAAGQFGRITSTVGRTVGLGTNRQVQFALRVNF